MDPDGLAKLQAGILVPIDLEVKNEDVLLTWTWQGGPNLFNALKKVQVHTLKMKLPANLLNHSLQVC